MLEVTTGNQQYNSVVKSFFYFAYNSDVCHLTYFYYKTGEQGLKKVLFGHLFSVDDQKKKADRSD